MQQGQCMSYVRSHVELEFVSVYMCAHTHVQMHTCASSLQEQRWTIRKAGNQGLFALLSRGEIVRHKDLPRLSGPRPGETGQVGAKHFRDTWLVTPLL